MRKIIFKRITFLDLDNDETKKIINNSGLFVFPSGPGLGTINQNNNYHNALKEADYVFFDSGYFVLLLKLLKNVSVKKYSGFKFLKFFFSYLSRNNDKSLFCIDPNDKFSQKNKKFFKKLRLNNIYSYVAPIYNTQQIEDYNLIKILEEIKPDYVMTNIGGGTQEILGLFLKKKLKFKTTILCTGGAISFFTGDQAPINYIIDRLFLGWLVRIIFRPKVFFFRYFKAIKLISIVFKEKIIVKTV